MKSERSVQEIDPCSAKDNLYIEWSRLNVDYENYRVMFY